jgi:hypothetical protein
VAGFTRRGEDFGVEEVGDGALEGTLAQCFFYFRRNVEKEICTVNATPATTMTRLKLCCVVRAAFSPTERSLHRTRPSSLITVTCLRGAELEDDVAPARAEVVKRAGQGRLEGSDNDEPWAGVLVRRSCREVSWRARWSTVSGESSAGDIVDQCGGEY